MQRRRILQGKAGMGVRVGFFCWSLDLYLWRLKLRDMLTLRYHATVFWCYLLGDRGADGNKKLCLLLQHSVLTFYSTTKYCR
jgi:hypothetical protein